MSDREMELKYRVEGRAGWLALVGPGGPGRIASRVLQENFYFDTPDLRLAREGALLRIRRQDGRCVATFKHGGLRDDEPGYFDALEIEAESSPGELEEALADPRRLIESPLEPVREARRRFGALPLRLVGRLENERVRREGRYSLEVDRLVYPDGGEAYEVEIETGDPTGARLWLEEELRARGIRAEPQSRTKLQELLARRGGVPPERPDAADPA